MTKDRLLACSVGMLLALGTAVALLWGPARSSSFAAQDASLNEEVRLQALQALVDGSPGIGDSHVDPDVGRILQPNVDGASVHGLEVRTNRFGMRGADFVPGPNPDSLRIVFLGDSYIFGWGVSEEARVGAVLERLLADRGMPDVECLHVGISSWNIQAETAYLRRNLAIYAPDLVVQVIVRNDLEDCSGVRGFGEPGPFTPRFRDRANAVISLSAQRFSWLLRSPIRTPLLNGLDHESRSRYDDAARSIAQLAEAVEASEGSYLLLAQWKQSSGVLHGRVLEGMPTKQTGLVPPEIFANPENWVSAEDAHWNEMGHELMARLTLARLIADGELAPPADVPDEVGSRLLAASRARGRWAARQPNPLPLEQPALSRLSFSSPEEMSKAAIAQIYTGIDIKAMAAPFVAVMLRRPGNKLHVRVRGLDRAGIGTVTLSVQAEGVQLGSFEVSPGEEALFSAQLPEALHEREHLAIYLRADDYVYARDLVERCVSYYVDSIELR